MSLHHKGVAVRLGGSPADFSDLTVASHPPRPQSCWQLPGKKECIMPLVSSPCALS